MKIIRTYNSTVIPLQLVLKKSIATSQTSFLGLSVISVQAAW